MKRNRAAVRNGLIGGALVIYLAAVGMIERFNDRNVVTGIIQLGLILLIITIGGFAYRASGRPKDGTAPPEPVMAGAVAGAASGAMVALFVIVVTLLAEAGYVARDMFESVTPALLDILTFQQNPWVGSAIMIVMAAGVGGLAGYAHRLPAEGRKLTFLGLGTLLIVGLAAPIVDVMVKGLGLPSGWLFRREGLTVAGALLVLVVTVALRWYLDRQGGFRRAAAKLPGITDSNIKKVGLTAAAVVVLALPWLVNSFISEVLGTVGLYILLGLGLNIVVGYAGLLDLGYVAFYAVGAYVTAVTTSLVGYLVTDDPLRPAQNGWTSFWLALPITVVIAFLIGVLIGAPVLRLRGDYLAIVTLGFGEIIRTLVLSDWLKPYFGGPQGVTDVPAPPPASFEFRQPQRLYYLILAFALLALFVSSRLKDSRIGRAWAAMREDEDIAEGMGVSVIKYKTLAFAIGAAVGCLGGAFFAAKLSVANPGSFTLLVSINVLAVVVLGGMGSIPGVVVGSLVLVGLPELLREFGEYRLHIYGAILVLIMLYRPAGLIPDKRRARELAEAKELKETSGVAAS